MARRPRILWCRPISIALSSLALSLAVACGGGGDDPAADTEVVAGAEVTDAGPVDTRPEASADLFSDSDEVAADASPVDGQADLPPDATGSFEPQPGDYAVLCQIDCTDDMGCGGAPMRCLTFQASGDRFCAVPCAATGPACPGGFACADVSGSPLCVPSRGDCLTATAGARCDGELLQGLCKHDFPLCSSSDWRPGYCTRPCGDDAPDACPPGAWRCDAESGGQGVCAPGWLDGPEACGRLPEQGLGAPCRDDDDCDGGACLQPPAGSPLAPFCTTSCDGDEACGEHAACLAVPAVGGEEVCVPDACACLADRGELYDQLLGALEIDRCDVMFPHTWLDGFRYTLAFDDWRLSRFHWLHDVPARALPALRQELSRLDDAPGGARVTEALALAAEALDQDTTDSPVGTSGTLAEALSAFTAASGGVADAALIADAVAQLPEDAAGALVPLVDALTGALLARAAISQVFGDAEVEALLFERAHGFVVPPRSLYGLAPTHPDVRRALSGGYALAPLLDHARALARAIEQLDVDLLAGLTDVDVRLPTPAGALVIRDAGDTTHTAGAYGGDEAIALLIDTGGDDTYLLPAGANVRLDHPVAVVLDLGGADHYTYVPVAEPPHPELLPEDDHGRYTPTTPAGEGYGAISLSDHARQGAGRLGIGMLYDLGQGHDRYESPRLSQGAGILGVGVLYDDGGDDIYASEAVAQGAGVFGVGLLIDEGGQDQYTGVHAVQGFGYASSYGLLYDADGGDAYVALPGPDLGGPALYPSSQNPEGSNSSMSQGMGFGRRADQSDGVFMSGGFGLLRDRAGDDRYEADIFAQASGYWFGTGILADGEGDDTYAGRWYVQGSSAHFANAFFIEDGGDDRYNEDTPVLATSIGVGHDFSLGLLYEASGDDHYHAPGLALGGGNSDGIGLLLDASGADHYLSESDSNLGWANAQDYPTYAGFEAQRCTGLFLDGGGDDVYDRPDLVDPPVGDDTIWVHPPTHEGYGSVESGGGIDGEGAIGL
jgi:hypothetical protein